MVRLAIHPDNRVRRFGLILFVPLFTLCTVAILLGLLGVFVVWLATVGALVSAIVVTDLTHRSLTWLTRPPIALQHRPIG